MTARRTLLTDAQLAAEIERCLGCAEKPCRGGCPVNCSPADFLHAARGGRPEDLRRAAAIIMGSNPLGGVCGVVCPDRHCMAPCTRGEIDGPIDIPACQATIVARARELDVMPEFVAMPGSGRSAAVVGGGPAGLGAAAVLAQRGVAVTVFEAGRAGGMAAVIPDFRLAHEVLEADLAFALSLGEVTLVQRRVEDPSSLLAEGFDAVVVTVGRARPLSLGVPGEELALDGLRLLREPDLHEL
jgi:NADPH-dependent glutamate synthase beta subunit-like oxidoreductase